MIPEFIQAIWPIILIFIGSLIWLIRLESKVMYLQKDYEAHKQELNDKESAMWSEIRNISTDLRSIMQSLSRLEGRLDGKYENKQKD